MLRHFAQSCDILLNYLLSFLLILLLIRLLTLLLTLATFCSLCSCPADLRPLTLYNEKNNIRKSTPASHVHARKQFSRTLPGSRRDNGDPQGLRRGKEFAGFHQADMGRRHAGIEARRLLPNSTFEQKSMLLLLLTDKLMPSIGNPHGPEEPIQRQIRNAFKTQAAIGWDRFFRGRVAKAWRTPIGTYYKIRKPGDSLTPDQWMRTAITELWTFSITIWKQRNSELHGTGGAISKEQLRKDTANEAAAVYQATIGKVSPTDSVVLHHARIEEILKLTKEHLDAYLASADVIIDQRDEPG
jgi:hypothetical protein